jgi:hypothetical protein
VDSVQVAPVGNSKEVLELNRILASRSFSKSPRLCSLLEFIVLHSVEGRHAELSEQQIGIHVFGRSPGYNSSEDTIVRGTARHLRQRLEHYYGTEGTADPMRIDIPRGGYVATFEDITTEHFRPFTEFPPSDSRISRSVFGPDTVLPKALRRKVLVLELAAAIFAIAALCFAVAYIQQKRLAQSAPPLTGPQPLWHAIFSASRKTLIVPGDESLDTYIAWEQHDVSLEQYATQMYHRESTVSLPPTHLDVPLSTRSATPMADLALVSILVRGPEHMGEPLVENSVEVRYGRDIVVADTHDNNLILIGSESFNPWVTLYQHEMDFVAHWDFKKDIYSVENQAPKPGELPLYQYSRQNPQPQPAITHIALLNNSQGLGRVLIIEGTTMGSTYGAVNFLTHESIWGPVIQKATDAHGKLRDFEVLLSGDMIHGGVGNTKVIALHIH